MSNHERVVVGCVVLFILACMAYWQYRAAENQPVIQYWHMCQTQGTC